MKHNQYCLGFELESSIPLPTAITLMRTSLLTNIDIHMCVYYYDYYYKNTTINHASISEPLFHETFTRQRDFSGKCLATGENCWFICYSFFLQLSLHTCGSLFHKRWPSFKKSLCYSGQWPVHRIAPLFISKSSIFRLLVFPAYVILVA